MKEEDKAVVSSGVWEQMLYVPWIHLPTLIKLESPRPSACISFRPYNPETRHGFSLTGTGKKLFHFLPFHLFPLVTVHFARSLQRFRDRQTNESTFAGQKILGKAFKRPRIFL